MNGNSVHSLDIAPHDDALITYKNLGRTQALSERKGILAET